MSYKITPVYNRHDIPPPDGDQCVVELKYVDKESTTEEVPELSIRIYRFPNDWNGYYLDFLPGKMAEHVTTTTTTQPTTTGIEEKFIYKPSNNALMTYWPDMSHPYGYDGRLMKQYPDGTKIHEELKVEYIDEATALEATVTLYDDVPGYLKVDDMIYIETTNKNYHGYYKIKDMMIGNDKRFAIHAYDESADSDGYCIKYPQEYSMIDLTSEMTAIREHLERGDIVIFGGWRKSGSNYYYTRPVKLELGLPEIEYENFIAGRIKNQGALATLSRVDVDHITDEAVQSTKLGKELYEYIVRSRELINFAYLKLALDPTEAKTVVHYVNLAGYTSSSGIKHYTNDDFAIILDGNGLEAGTGSAHYEVTEVELSEELGADIDKIVSVKLDWTVKTNENTDFEVWVKYDAASTAVQHPAPMEPLPETIDGVNLIDADTIYLEARLITADNLTTPFLYSLQTILTVDLST